MFIFALGNQFQTHRGGIRKRLKKRVMKKVSYRFLHGGSQEGEFRAFLIENGIEWDEWFSWMNGNIYISFLITCSKKEYNLVSAKRIAMGI